METIYLTKKQLAKRWGCSIKTVERLASDPNNNLPVYDLGGKKFKMDDILRFEETRKQFFGEDEQEE